jgi:hypothetical protein
MITRRVGREGGGVRVRSGRVLGIVGIVEAEQLRRWWCTNALREGVPVDDIGGGAPWVVEGCVAVECTVNESKANGGE